MDLTAGDWAAIGAAAFTALAAGAAWRTVALDHKRQREARQPNVAGGVTVGRPSMLAALNLVNAGPGLAIALAYVVVIEGRVARGYAGNGMLAAGQEARVELGRVSSREGTTTAVWLCYDLDGNEHLWSADQRHRVTSRKDVRARASHPIDDAFRAMYPDVPIP
jgi:hypothetical protein